MENLIEILEGAINAGWSFDEISELTPEDILDNFGISVTEQELDEAVCCAANNMHIIF